MPRLITLASWFIVAILCGSIFAANTQPTVQSINKMPLSFTKNMGQWDDRVLFRANAGGATMWFTKEGVTYQFTRRIPSPPSPLPEGEGVGQNRFGFDAYDPRTDTRDSIEQLVLTAKFLGANPTPEVIAEGQMEYKCNYFIGNDPSKWHTDVPNYEAITLKNIYPGIDLKYYGRRGNGRAAYEFIAAPGADIAQIKVEYEGVEETSVDDEGRMILKTKWGEMTAGIGLGVSGDGLASLRFVSNSENTHDIVAKGQSIGQESSGTLTLRYSTYLGGGYSDYGCAIAVDGSGSAYVTGQTYSSNFPVLNPYQGGHHGGYDVFVTKFSSSGNGLIYSTYLGGANSDYGTGIAVDDGDHACVTGHTASRDFPTVSPFQSEGYKSAFVTKISSSGNSLIYSTYLGGYAGGEGTGIAMDGDGNAYVTGNTGSPSFPILNPFQTDQGGEDAFVTKFSSSGSLIYSTYLGGGGDDYAGGIAIDKEGNAYITGQTRSGDYPLLNPYQTYQGGINVFVTKLSSSGSSVIYSTYLGGGLGWSIAVDDNGHACVTGRTASPDFPILNPYQTHQRRNDVFVTKLSSFGNSLIYSTYIGGGDEDYGYGIAVDSNGNAYVACNTYSSDYPTQNSYQTFQGAVDVSVTKLSSSGSSLVYSSFLGGSGEDWVFGIAVDHGGNAYVTGNTWSSDFPTLNPYQTAQDWYDAFVTKLTWTPNYVCGDVNTDEQIDILDVVFLINYIFVGGPAPQQLSLADVNCSGGINIGDVVLLINYIFRNGSAPCAGCE